MIGPFNNPNVDDTGFYVPFYATAFGAAPPTIAANQFSTVVVKPHQGQQAESVLKTLRREVSKVDANLPLYFTGTPRFHIDSAGAAFRIIASMFTMFGGIAILLAAVGIYGVMSFAVNQRRQEFGVRMALGADNGRILGMVLKQGSWQVVGGLTVGMGLALALAVLGRSGIDSLLVGVDALDPVTYATVAALIAVVSLFAVMVPARRATRVDPMLALRAE